MQKYSIILRNKKVTATRVSLVATATVISNNALLLAIF